MKINTNIIGVAQLLILTLFLLKSSLAQNCTKNADCGGKLTCCPGLIKTCHKTCAGDYSPVLFKGSQPTFCKNGKYYRLFPEKKSWFKAMVTCCQGKGTLPEVTSTKESEFLRGTELGNYIWIGGHSIFHLPSTTSLKDRKFQLVGSKSPVDFSFLEKYIGNNKQEGPVTGESCLGGYEEANVQWWNDWPCKQELPFICYYPDTQCT